MQHDLDEMEVEVTYPEGEYLGLTIAKIRHKCEEEGECWLWRGYKTKRSNVPMFGYKRKMYRVRHAIAQIIGHLYRSRDGIWATKCGLADCVNPQHLQFRTGKAHAQFMANALASHTVIKGLRDAKIARSVVRKISPQAAQDIVSSELKTTELATLYGVSEGLIRRYKRRAPMVPAASVFSALVSRL